MPRAPRPVALSRLRLLDAVREAFTGMIQRPGRSALTMLGTVLGVSAFVGVLGLTSTAADQIDQRFDALTATTVTIEDRGLDGSDDQRISFPLDAVARVDAIEGVVSSGMYFTPPIEQARVSRNPGSGAGGEPGLPVMAVDTGIFDVTHTRLIEGRLWDGFAQGRAERVVVLGESAAARLAIADLRTQPAVFINDVAYLVIGIAGSFERIPTLDASVLIPTSTALAEYGEPQRPRATMLAETRLGAAAVVADQAATALRPDAPGLFAVRAPADPQELRSGVESDVESLFLALAAVSLVIGAVGIANTTLVSVLERTSEIGLRRALGARPVHISSQFLLESAGLGAFGGLLGTSLGVGLTVSVAAARSWTPVIEPVTVTLGPAIGCLVGLAAGIYPSLRAARIQPVEALRR